MSGAFLFERSGYVTKKGRLKPAVKEVSAPKKPEKKSSSEISLRTKLIGGVAVSAVLAGGWVLHKGEVEDDCTSASRQMIQVGAVGEDNGLLHAKNRIRSLLFINDGRTISDIAETLSHDRGYTITTERIAAANVKQSFIRFDQQGELINSMPVENSKGGSFCVNVPGPVYNGYHLVEGDTETLTSIADENKVDITTLEHLNPNIDQTPTEPLPLSSAIRVSPNIDTSLAYRTMQDAEKNVNAMSDTPKERDRIVMANIALVSSGVSLTPGSEAYLPVAETAFLKEQKISADTLVKTYPKDSVALNVDFHPEPKKKAPKKATPEVPDTSDTIESANDIPGDIKSIMLDVYPHSRHVPAAVLAGQLKAESNFRADAQSSAKAKGIAQFLDDTWSEWGEQGKSPYDPEAAISAQSAYMNHLFEWAQAGVKNGSLKGDPLTLAIQAYNWGMGNVSAFGRVATPTDIGAHFGNDGIVPREAVEYPRRVFDAGEAYGFKEYSPKSFSYPSLHLSTKTDIKKGWEPKRYPDTARSADGFTPNLRTLFGELKKEWYVPWVGGVIKPGEANVGHSSTSDHYSGHALDIMLDPRERNDNAYRQEEMTNWLMANAARLNIKYIIVNDQIWSVEHKNEGWRDYATSAGTFEHPKSKTAYTLGHYDHIHVSVF